MLSVCMATYNGEKYINEQIDSILSQLEEDDELIISDDGSTDSSLSILNEYKERDNRFTILTQKNLNAGVARNNGLKIAKGEYLSFLDSGCTTSSSVRGEG